MKAEDKANEIISSFTGIAHIRNNRLNSLRAALKCVNYIIKAVSKYEYGYWEFVQSEIIKQLMYEENLEKNKILK